MTRCGNWGLLDFMTRCCNWGLQKSKHDSIWGLENSKLDLMTRCGNWGLQKPSTKTEAQQNNSNPCVAVVIGASNNKNMIRFGASKIQISTS